MTQLDRIEQLLTENNALLKELHNHLNVNQQPQRTAKEIREGLSLRLLSTNRRSNGTNNN